MKVLFLLPLVLCSTAFADATATLSGQLTCFDCDATATLYTNQTIDFASDNGKLKVKKEYTYSDSVALVDYTYTLKLSCGGTNDTKYVADSNGADVTGFLEITLDNSNQWYKKSYSIETYAYAADIEPLYSCQDSQTAKLSISLKNTTFAFDTKVYGGAPSAIYKWGAVTVSGTAYSEPPESGKNWETVKDDTTITITASNGSWTGSATVYTGAGDLTAGRWTKTFACPTLGWDEDHPWLCKAELASGQMTTYAGSTTYKYSYSQTNSGVYTSKDMVKAMLTQMVDNTTGQLYNPFDSISLAVDFVGFNSAGTSINTSTVILPPGATSSVNLSTYTGGSLGSVQIQGGGPTVTFANGGATSSAGGFRNSLKGTSVAWGSQPSGLSRSTIAFSNDPDPTPEDVTVTVYDTAGTIVGDTLVTLNPYGMATVVLPDDIAGLPPSGTGSVVVGGSSGADVLSGTVARENLSTGAVSADALTPGQWMKLSAPLIDVSMSRATSLVVCNPSSATAEIAMTLFDTMGVPVVTEPSTIIAAHGSHVFDASLYVGMSWQGSAEIDVLAGEGVCGTVLFDDDQGTEAASIPMGGEPAPRICVPIVGQSINWDALYCVHNPSDGAILGRATFRNADGSVGSEELVNIDPHVTAVLESNTYEWMWAEPWATFDFEVIAGEGGVVGGAVLSDPIVGTLAAAAASPVPAIAAMTSPWTVGWHLISLPADPLDEAVEDILALPVQEGNTISRSLLNYTQESGYGVYPLHMTEIRRGRGYWVHVTAPTGWEYECAPPASDFEIPLDEGWTLWGYPFMTEQSWANCLITDGINTHDPADAETAGWIQQTIYGYEADDYFAVPGDQTEVEPWRGYWLLSHQAGLTLIVPAP
ncbi:MAG: hypothetical protein JXA69_07335 [Phycisphaerae bacterium]|nr:hypothetical protein [Phycisphaerae bacterium]